MGQSLANIIIHIVFSTKERLPWIQDREVRKNLHAYLSGIAKRQKCPAIIIGGVADHVHLLCRMDRDYRLQNLSKNSNARLRYGSKHKVQAIRHLVGKTAMELFLSMNL